MPAGERARVLAEICEQSDRFHDGGGSVIGKRPRYHGLPPESWPLAGVAPAIARFFGRLAKCAAQQQHDVHEPPACCTNGGAFAPIASALLSKRRRYCGAKCCAGAASP